MKKRQHRDDVVLLVCVFPVRSEFLRGMRLQVNLLPS